jgi:branched-chain amino acid transport system permease protein
MTAQDLDRTFIARRRKETSVTASRRRRIPAPSLTILIVVLLAVVVTGPGDVMSVATTASIFGIAAIGLTVLAGPTRVVNLGASTFIALGAFVAAYLNNVVKLDFLLSMLAAMGACIAVGWIIAPIASRLAGVYIAVITVGIAFLAQHIFRIAEPFTGGTVGVQLNSVPFLGLDLSQPTQVDGLVLDTQLVYFVLCAIVLVTVALAATHLLQSRIGRALRVIGTSSLTARSFGINPARYRGVAFVFSAALGGLAGALLAGSQGFVAWDQFDLILSVDLVAVIVLGGLGSVYGAIVGAAILYALPALVDALAGSLPFLASESASGGLSPEQFTSVLYGLALVLVMILEPGGLAALLARARARLESPAAPTRKEEQR